MPNKPRSPRRQIQGTKPHNHARAVCLLLARYHREALKARHATAVALDISDRAQQPRSGSSPRPSLPRSHPCSQTQQAEVEAREDDLVLSRDKREQAALQVIWQPLCIQTWVRQHFTQILVDTLDAGRSADHRHRISTADDEEAEGEGSHGRGEGTSTRQDECDSREAIFDEAKHRQACEQRQRGRDDECQHRHDGTQHAAQRTAGGACAAVGAACGSTEAIGGLAQPEAVARDSLRQSHGTG
mmetsp:Transcript_9430/g.33355  ORF Transcript_9430/g.33355 Transcript_9430/m.33355 type:complete len:243 (+) Transcript_9430:1225-1953(+)